MQMAYASCDCEDCLADLLCDLTHWADKARLNFPEEFRRARFHYCAELADQEAAASMQISLWLASAFSRACNLPRKQG